MFELHNLKDLKNICKYCSLAQVPFCVGEGAGEHFPKLRPSARLKFDKFNGFPLLFCIPSCSRFQEMPKYPSAKAVSTAFPARQEEGDISRESLFWRAIQFQTKPSNFLLLLFGLRQQSRRAEAFPQQITPLLILLASQWWKGGLCTDAGRGWKSTAKVLGLFEVPS